MTTRSLAGFDFVVASVHSGFTMSRTDMEARIIRAMENPYTTILGHPTGRLLLARDGYQVDMGAHHRGGGRHRRRDRAECEPLPSRYRLEAPAAGQRRRAS